MHTLLTPLFIFLALVAAVVLANIIMYLIVIGGKLLPFADPAMQPSIEESSATVSRNGNVCTLDCPCHSQQDFPGMRCMDCYGEPCDEGTRQ